NFTFILYTDTPTYKTYTLSLHDALPIFVPGIAAIDQHRRRQAVKTAGLGHLGLGDARDLVVDDFLGLAALVARGGIVVVAVAVGDRKSTRLNSSHVKISYAVFCLKKKK